jgi:hypothetical protein
MKFTFSAILTSYNYLEWKPKITLLLKHRGIYQINMEMEVYHDSVDKNNDYFNRQYMTIGCIFWSISSEILHQVYDESRDSTPNELWTKLEVLFGNKEYCEYLMQEIEKIETKENPLEYQASYSKYYSTQASAQICVPLIADDFYSISFYFFLNFIWKTSCMNLMSHRETLFHAPCMHLRIHMHESHESQGNTFACAMHACKEPHPCILGATSMHLRRQKGGHEHPIQL